MRHFLVVAVLTLFAASSALAVPVDFRSSPFDEIVDGATNPYVYADSGLTVTALYWDGTALSDGAALYQDGEDGIGVVSRSYEYDEIEGVEFLNLHFDESQYLNSMLITDFFIETENDGSGSYSETGYYLLGDFSYSLGDWTQMTAVESGGTNGELAITLTEPAAVTDIWFWAPGMWNYSSDFGGYLEDHEFSVAGIDVRPVPEPSSLMLLGLGLAGLSAFRRRIAA